MKNFFKRPVAFVLCLVMSLSMSVLCFAEPAIVDFSDRLETNKSEIDTQSQLPELAQKYGYEKNYKYTDESRARVLKSSVCKIVFSYSGTFEYTPVQVNENALYNYLSDYFSEKDIESMFYWLMACEHIVDHRNSFLSVGDNSVINYIDDAAMWSGSGVVIREDGYIATNEHVVDLSNLNKELVLGLADDEFLNDIKSVVERLNISIDGVILEELVYGLLKDAFKFSDEEHNFVANFPDSDGNVSLDGCIKYPARVVAEGISNGNESIYSDAAIIKIDCTNLVALELSKSYPEHASSILGAGFPGADSVIFDEESFVSIYTAIGNVSSLKSVKGTDYKPIGVNLTISGGSSGGPSIDEGLDVEGLNTYSYAEDNRFAYMIPARFVTDLAKSKNVVPAMGDVSKVFLTGLQMLEKQNGKGALECFTYVKQKNSNIPYINNLIESAQSLIDENGEVVEPQTPQTQPQTPQTQPQTPNPNDNTSQNGTNGSTIPKEDDSSLLIWILCIGGGVVVIGVVIVVIVLVKKSKKKKIAVPVKPVTPVAPAVPVKPVTPVAPAVPVKPVTPATPAVPVKPVTPVAPATPVAPVTPPKPVTPVAPATHTVPKLPTIPEQPKEPEEGSEYFHSADMNL